jgi:hypothetical protein
MRADPITLPGDELIPDADTRQQCLSHIHQNMVAYTGISVTAGRIRSGDSLPLPTSLQHPLC